MNKKLAVIVLTWNDWKNTIECLESIFNNSFENFDIVLVDNNSDPIHIEKIKEYLLTIKNLYLVGRNSDFEYIHTHDIMRRSRLLVNKMVSL